MRFSLLHASRERAALAEQAIEEWTSKESGAHEREYILSLDTDDPQLEEYRAVAARRDVRVIVNDNRSNTSAVNHAAAAATGDILIVLSDDFGCPQNWDLAIADVVKDRRDVAVIVHDNVDGRIMTLPIVGRDFYRAVGFIYHPAYVSMYSDDDLTEVARRRGVLIDARHLTFPHRHATVVKTLQDATYRRHNSNRAWWHGWRTFQKRKIDGFGERRRGIGPTLARLRIDARYWTRTCASAVKRLLTRRPR